MSSDEVARAPNQRRRRFNRELEMLRRVKRFAGANFTAGGRALMQVGLGKPAIRFW